MREYFLPPEKRQELSSEINEYEREVTNNQNNIDRLKNELDGRNITREEWQKTQEDKKELEKSISKLNNKIGRKEEKQENIGQKLKKKQKLKKRMREVQHKNDLLNELSYLFRGKKFVEFIAQRHLKYIAREASQKLQEITGGHYALELDSEYNFIIRDDYNGGTRRKTHTLSGGETFLTSLSLALALSNHIQMGNSSLEFFFLDEGFGTLDADLLDIVINTLERLQEEKLSIGLISHVEELKERIPRKLMVRPPIPGKRGTKVVFKKD